VLSEKSARWPDIFAVVLITIRHELSVSEEYGRPVSTVQSKSLFGRHVMDGSAPLPLPWWAREGVYGSQTVPFYTELDASVPSAAPNAAPVTVFDGTGKQEEEPVTSATNTFSAAKKRSS